MYYANTQYLEKLLKLAMAKSGYEYDLQPVPMGVVSENRSHNYLNANRYNVHWMMTSPEHEKALIPIKIPLYKGLIGWRILFIRNEDENIFSEIKDNDALQQLQAGMAHDWPDTSIMQQAGYNVIPMYSNEGRFNFLKRGRCDYFSRSAIEIWNERKEAGTKGIIVEKNLALHYPAAYYFFVSPKEIDLAAAITKGLTVAIEDGDFEALFKERFLQDILRSNIKHRTILEIDNPHFHNSPELNDRKLWFDPHKY